MNRTARHAFVAFTFALLLVPLASGRTAGAERQPARIVVHQRQFIEKESGRPFVPFGVTYYRPGTGWAPQLWKQFDAEATRRDFARLKKQGANVVRVFISFGSFYTEPGRLDHEGLAKFDTLLALADEAGLYVHPTGPDAWEGQPAWTNESNLFSNDTNEQAMKALEDYWRMFVSRYRGRSTIWAYDLRNEPSLAWDTPYLRTAWDAWRRSSPEAIARAGPDGQPSLAAACRLSTLPREHCGKLGGTSGCGHSRRRSRGVDHRRIAPVVDPRRSQSGRINTQPSVHRSSPGTWTLWNCIIIRWPRARTSMKGPMPKRSILPFWRRWHANVPSRTCRW